MLKPIDYDALSNYYIIDNKTCNFYIDLNHELIRVSMPAKEFRYKNGILPSLNHNGFPTSGIWYKKINVQTGEESDISQSRKDNLDKRFLKRTILNIKNKTDVPKIFLDRADIASLL